MARESKTKFAILGMLDSAPQCGYDIKKELERSAMFIWNESYGQIYPMLRKMVAAELCEVEVFARDDQPDMKMYTITDKGRDELKRWLSMPADPHPVRNEALLKIYYGAHTTAATTQAHVMRLRDRLAQQLQDMQEQLDRLSEELEDNENVEYWRLALRYGELVNGAIQTWCDEAEAKLDEL